jgi:anti-sigma-K factor RskA
MMKTNCKTIRRELDELNLGEESSPSVVLHLQQCVECQEFHQSRTKLRQLVGSLETVEAPADFDFRLRARLAGEKAGSAHGRVFANWSPGFRALAAAVIVLVVGIVLFVSQRRNEQPRVAKVQVEEPATAGAVSPKPPEVGPVPAERVTPVPTNAASSAQNRKTSNTATLPALRGKRQMATADFSSVPATVLRREGSAARVGSTTVFPIDAANQSLRVSLDDGSGNWRTISLPTVSFGSQRVVASGSVSNQLAAKGIW